MFLKTALNSDHSIKFRYKIRPLFFSPIDIIDAQDNSTTTLVPTKAQTTMNPMTGTTSDNDAVIMMSSCKYYYFHLYSHVVQIPAFGGTWLFSCWCFTQLSTILSFISQRLLCKLPSLLNCVQNYSRCDEDNVCENGSDESDCSFWDASSENWSCFSVFKSKNGEMETN